MTNPIDPATDGAHTDFADTMSYGDYLHLNPILNAQHPRSDAHDEMLFIIQHQTSELWMKLVIHELNSARDALNSGTLEPAFKMLARVARIFEQLNNAWDVLRTMTPSEYTEFRGDLSKSSGFQSHQYRLIEFILGNRNPNMLKPHAHTPDALVTLNAELARPSFYDEAVRLLFTTLGSEPPTPNMTKPHSSNPVIMAHWKTVYDNPVEHWQLYELAEKLMDLEDYFRRWRFNHVTTVERVIGFKRGTGGTSGVSYLRRMLDVELFPELWHVRGDL